MTDTATFKREERYIVIKRKHMSESQERDLREGMRLRGIGTVECVVVEADWPEYDTVWQMIEDRVTGNTRLASTPQPSGEGWRDIEALVAACEREFTSELTEMDGDPEDGPWRDDDDEAVSHGMADDGHTLVPGEITFGHIRRARAALTNLTAPRSSQPSDMIGEAVAAERERCAKIAESRNDGLTTTHTKIAAAIRLPTATEGEMS